MTQSTPLSFWSPKALAFAPEVNLSLDPANVKEEVGLCTQRRRFCEVFQGCSIVLEFRGLWFPGFLLGFRRFLWFFYRVSVASYSLS